MHSRHPTTCKAGQIRLACQQALVVSVVERIPADRFNEICWVDFVRWTAEAGHTLRYGGLIRMRSSHKQPQQRLFIFVVVVLCAYANPPDCSAVRREVFSLQDDDDVRRTAMVWETSQYVYTAYLQYSRRTHSVGSNRSSARQRMWIELKSDVVVRSRSKVCAQWSNAIYY